MAEEASGRTGARVWLPPCSRAVKLFADAPLPSPPQEMPHLSLNGFGCLSLTSESRTLVCPIPQNLLFGVISS